ncbi:MAG: glycerophosphodiester phosphodiesterase family protein [Christensenellales bacterium]|jgi:glycerophosphoryl diester phosphodiesterase
MIYVLLAILALLALWLFLCAPSRGRRRADHWRGQLFAHRGLFGEGRPENSVAAFVHAQDEGYGVEMDIQATRDGQLVVFHDDDARRMAGDPRLIRDMTLAEVQALSIDERGTRIPTLGEVLEAMGERGVLLVEIKSAPNIASLTQKTVECLKGYGGRYVVESFDPLCLYWLRRHAPEIIRGQLVHERAPYRRSVGALGAFALSKLLGNVLARPDFVAYARGMRHSATIRLQRALFKTPLAAWTIKDAAEVRDLAQRGEMPIFEQVD